MLSSANAVGEEGEIITTIHAYGGDGPSQYTPGFFSFTRKKKCVNNKIYLQMCR